MSNLHHFLKSYRKLSPVGWTFIWLGLMIISILFLTRKHTPHFTLKSPLANRHTSDSLWMAYEAFTRPKPIATFSLDSALIKNLHPRLKLTNNSSGSVNSFRWDFNGIGEIKGQVKPELHPKNVHVMLDNLGQLYLSSHGVVPRHETRLDSTFFRLDSSAILAIDTIGKLSTDSTKILPKEEQHTIQFKSLTAPSSAELSNTSSEKKIKELNNEILKLKKQFEKISTNRTRQDSKVEKSQPIPLAEMPTQETPPKTSLKTLLQEHPDDVKAILQKLYPVSIAFDSIQTMYLDEMQPFTLILDPKRSPDKTKQSLSLYLNKQSVPTRTNQLLAAHSLSTMDVVEAHLSGTGFAINPVNHEVQLLKKDEQTRWSWEITPQENNTNNPLHLTINTKIRLRDETEFYELDAYHLNVEVKETFHNLITRMLVKYAGVLPFIFGTASLWNFYHWIQGKLKTRTTKDPQPPSPAKPAKANQTNGKAPKRQTRKNYQSLTMETRLVNDQV